MKIFVTGSTGFVGSNLVSFYRARGHEVYAWQRDQDLAGTLESFAPDAIINSAAEIYDPEKMFFPNIVLTQTCLEYVKSSKQWVRMVQIGSSSEYGPTDHPTSETTLLKPVDFYQGTKAAATLMCQGWARHFNLPIWIARPYSVYGPGERPHRLFPRLYRAFTHSTPMTLYQGYHDFIYIDDFVRGIDEMLNTWDCEPGEVVNFGSGVQISNFEVLEIWKKITNVNAPISCVTELSKAFENNVWVCDTRHARDKYRFEVQYDLQSGIRKFLLKANYDA